MRLLSPRYRDGDQLELDGLKVRLRVSGRARHVSLRVDPVSGEVIAVAPSVRRLPDAVAFADQRHAWATRQLAKARTPPLTFDGPLMVFGVPTLSDGGDEACAIRAIKVEAARVFAQWAAGHCASLDVPTPAIGIGDARTRWGSCWPGTTRRLPRIRLSWRLALAPVAVADYVVAHECAHLIEANHGPRFWAVVHGLVGEVKPHRAWLRAHGPRLHDFGRRG